MGWRGEHSHSSRRKPGSVPVPFSVACVDVGSWPGRDDESGSCGIGIGDAEGLRACVARIASIRCGAGAGLMVVTEQVQHAVDRQVRIVIAQAFGLLAALRARRRPGRSQDHRAARIFRPAVARRGSSARLSRSPCCGIAIDGAGAWFFEQRDVDFGRARVRGLSARRVSSARTMRRIGTPLRPARLSMNTRKAEAARSSLRRGVSMPSSRFSYARTMRCTSGWRTTSCAVKNVNLMPSTSRSTSIASRRPDFTGGADRSASCRR